VIGGVRSQQLLVQKVIEPLGMEVVGPLGMEVIATLGMEVVSVRCGPWRWYSSVEENTYEQGESVREHLSVSLLPLSSPTLPLFICTSPIPLYHLQGPHSKANDFRIQSPMTFQKSTHQMSSTSRVPLHSYLSSIG
jgi:hypothetical protein